MTSGSLYSVIPAGGSGTRLWPLSRAGHPKFLHALVGPAQSMLQATAARVAALSPPERTFVVTGAAHAAAVARQLPGLPEENLLVEPSPRDSCAAIGLAAAVIAERDPDAIMGSFAADHLVRRPEAFQEAIQTAIEGARQGLLMTVGITPTHPETGYGYLRMDGEAGSARGGSPDIVRVAEFKEKPTADVAAEYLRSGRYLWNASMFVWRVEVFLAELARQQPELHAGLRAIAAAWGTPDQDRTLGEIWPGLPRISVDHAVMEGAAPVGRVATVPGNFGWTDVGDFHTLGEVLAEEAFSGTDDAGNVIVADPDTVVLHDTTGSVVVGQSGRVIATVGLRDAIVVDTADAVLVCSRKQAQEIKSIVDEIKRRGGSHSHLL